MLEFKGHMGRVHDVAWAPSVGRSYHLIATAGGDGRVALWKVTPDSMLEPGAPVVPFGTSTVAGADWTVVKSRVSLADGAMVAAFNDHDGKPVWRVEFNITGTVVASSADDGKLRLRRQNLGGGWEEVAAITTVERDDATTVASGGGGGGGGGGGAAAAAAAAAAVGGGMGSGGARMSGFGAALGGGR